MGDPWLVVPPHYPPTKKKKREAKANMGDPAHMLWIGQLGVASEMK